MVVKLPGGLENNGSIQRQAKFRTITGQIEQKLIELDSQQNTADYVSEVLATVLESIGTQTADYQCMAKLCTADRQYLMLRLSALFGGEQMWLKLTCGYCDAMFDVETRRCDLPVKEAGSGFPLVTFLLENKTITAHVPTGKDQQCLQSLSDDEAMQKLLKNCIYRVNGEPPGNEFFTTLSATDIDVIDKALDDAAPAVCNQLLVNCPECGREQYAELDHYTLGGMNENYFYDEVHMLASHYHWSEKAILELPQMRRHLYLDKINRSAGMLK